MKTTLKRGVGRTAGMNGNVRAVYPPAISPAMRRYRQPPPPPRSRLALVGRIALWVLVAALMLAGGVAGGTYLYVERDIAEGLAARSFDVKVAQKKLDAAIPGEPTIALVLGYDKRIGPEAAVTGNSDTLMLVRVDPQLEAISLLSFPRDLIVDVRCPGRPPVRDRINSAYPRCGAQGSLLTVRHLTNLKINYLLTVNFRGFKQIVAHLGGVWLDVDRRYFNDNSSGGERYAEIDLQPGYQKLNGEKALQFVRYRHLDSDFYRLARQQLFVRALRQRIKAFSALDLPKLVKTVTSNVELGHVGEFNARTVLGYSLFAYDLPDGHVIQSKIDVNCYQGIAEITAAESCVRDAIADFVQPDVEAPLEATDAALRRTRPAAAPPPAKTTVTVLNGNGQPGAAATAGSQLASRGYKVVSGGDGNAPSWKYARSEVYYGATPRSKAAAERLRRLFGEARLAPLPPEIEPLSNRALVTVILGDTYHGSIGAPAAAATPERQPPAVRPDASAGPLLRDAAKRVPYPLYLPTRIERNSSLSQLTPIRVYQLGDHNTVRLTFTNGIEYWGIQMTDWKDAPVLADPNEVLTIGGRKYRLYYDGSHLRMVVLETEQATYWVVNSLLETLSNATMLGIAKGLQPLRR